MRSIFSLFPMGFRNETQNWTSRFHNLSNFIQILKFDTSMSLWMNSLIIYIQIYVFGEGHNFDPFSCSIFPYFQWVSEWEPKNCTSRFQNLSNFIPILKFDTSLSLWMNSLIIYIQIYLLGEGHNFDPFSCSIFPYFQWVSEWEPKTALPDSITWEVWFQF